MSDARLDAHAETMTWLEEADESLLDLVDHVINKGVVLSGEVFIGIADVDLLYLRIAAVLCSADRVTGFTAGESDPAVLEEA